MSDVNCPSCGTTNSIKPSDAWCKVGRMPIICVHCATIYWADIESESKELIVVNKVPVFKVQIPEINEGAWVYIINREHEKYLEPGKVIQKDHKHYRIEFSDGFQLWVPQHWVEKVLF